MSGFPWSIAASDMNLTADEWRELKTHFYRIERLIRMATQAEVDAITAEVTALEAPLTDLGNSIDNVESQLQAAQTQLAQAGVSVDLSGLRAAADAVTAQVASLGSKIPASPTASGTNLTTSTDATPSA